jgi:hypothetical protein
MKILPLILFLWLMLGVLQTTSAQAAKTKPMPNAGEKTFAIFDVSSTGETLLSVPFYFAPGEVPDLKSATARGANGKTIALQARVLSRHPRDKSVRAAMLRGVAKNLNAGDIFSLTPENSSEKPLLKVENGRAEILGGARRIVVENGTAHVFRGGKLEAKVAPLAPNFPQNFGPPVLEVVENGAQFAWLALTFPSAQWKMRFEIKADALGQIEFIARLLAHEGEHAFATFGFAGEVAPFADLKINGAPANQKKFQLRDEARRVQTINFIGSTPDENSAATTFAFPDGAHIRQGRMEINGAQFQMWRDVSLDKTKPQYLFREGQERSFAFALPAAGSTPDANLQHAHGHVSATRRAAVVRGEKPTDWGELESLRHAMTRYVPKLQSLDGDDWGDLTISVARENSVYEPASLTRLDHGEDFLDDYYLGGERLLADVALRWAQNYLELHLYRGKDQNAFGAERYALTAENFFPNFNQKGLFLLMHAWEETGDVRFEKAGLAAADRMAKLMQTRDFFPSYNLNGGFSTGNNTRTAYMAADLCKFYKFTDDEKYLQAARKIIEKLEAMRARTASHDELTTNFHTGQKTAPLLSEGVANPFALGNLALHSDGTGVLQSPGGFPKPFILDYHLRGALALLRHEENEAARSLLTETADYLVENRNLFGTWNYPQVHSPTAILQVTASVGDDLLLAHERTGNKNYLTVAIEQAKFLTQLFDATRSATFDLRLAGGKPYFYAEDFTTADLHRSSVATSQISRDFLAHAFTFYNHYFARFPAQTAILREPLQNQNARWIVEKAPIENRDDRPPSSIVADFAAAEKAQPTRAFEEVFAPSKITPEIGNSFVYLLHNESPSDDGSVSTLRLFENDKELLPAHSLHAKIRNEGQGHWSHWGKFGNRMVLFSASDNSDPRTNGRRYKVRQEASGAPDKGFAAWEAFLKKYPESLWEYSRLAQLAEGTTREAEFLEKFVAVNPRHPRSGAARLKLFRLTGDAKWLRETMANLPGSIWARHAQTRLWVRGEDTRPDCLLTNDTQAATGFRETQNLATAARQTEIFARRTNDTLLLRVVGHDWKKSAPPNSSLQLYFDVTESHENWISFVIEADGDSRLFYGASWPGKIAAPQKNDGDWTANQTRDGNHLIFEIQIPFAKLGLTPQADEDVLLGFEAIRRDQGETSFWCKSTKPDAVFPGDFGLLLLRGKAGSTPREN